MIELTETEKRHLIRIIDNELSRKRQSVIGDIRLREIKKKLK